MNQAITVLVVVVSLVVGFALGFLGSRYLPFDGSIGENSLSQFVMNSPTTPWVADVQGVITELRDGSISLQPRIKDGTTKEVYSLNLAPRENLIVERLEIGPDTNVTASRVNYEDLKVGDEVVVTVSSDGRAESLVISKITIIPRAPDSQ